MASTSSSAPLSASSLVALMLSSLPESAEPHLRNPFDAVALLCHACMLAVDFRLVGLGEDHKIETSSDAENTKALPLEWNATTSSDYSFRYKHAQSSLEYLIKVNRLGSKAVINGLGIGDDRVRSFDIAVKDYTSEASFPYNRSANLDEAQRNRDFNGLFISDGRIGDFSALFKINIIQSLLPGFQKEGYTEDSTSTNTSGNQRSNDAAGRERERYEREDDSHRPPLNDPLPPFAQPRPFYDPLADAPRRPIPAGDFPPPGFEDEHEILRPANRGGFGGPQMPMSGERDLYPPGLGPNDPLRVGGGLGGGPRGGGMYPAFDDPMFGGDGGAGGGWDNRAPPGARYDPVGPGDGPPFNRGGPRFPRNGPGGGGFGGPPNPFSGFSNNDFI